MMIEGHVIKAILSMVMKMSEQTFRPMFYKVIALWCTTCIYRCCLVIYLIGVTELVSLGNQKLANTHHTYWHFINDEI